MRISDWSSDVCSSDLGKPVPVEELPTLADSLGGGIGLRNRHTFAMVRKLVDEVILVDEAEIAGASRHAYAEERQIVQGGAAVVLAALLSEGPPARGPTAVHPSDSNNHLQPHQRTPGAQ